MEILRLYADRFCRLQQHCVFVGDSIDSIGLLPSGAEQLEPMIRGLIVTLDEMKVTCDSLGMEATRDTIQSTLISWRRYKDRNLLSKHCSEISRQLEMEFQRRVCFILPRSSHSLYENPCEKWERVLSVFPDARYDIEEMNRCMAFNRYAAAVFHVLLAVEFGIVELGKFLGVRDRKPGWDATCNVVEKILKEGRNAASPRVRRHFSFLEVINKDMQSMKMAWRNKVSHSANNLFVMTSDFKPEVAEKIISACHGFMLVLATEGPNKSPKAKRVL